MDKIRGLPLVTLGVYLPGKLRADNYLACSSTMAKAMDPVVFMRISGTNLSSPEIGRAHV